jgi:NTP pyrophosphatase (non-canonical NTP hydrolase)
MEEKYLPKDLNGKLARLSEECAEVIQAVCKAQRFGLSNYHPITKEINSQAIIRECEDLKHAINDVLNYKEGDDE